MRFGESEKNILMVMCAVNPNVDMMDFYDAHVG